MLGLKNDLQSDIISYSPRVTVTSLVDSDTTVQNREWKLSMLRIDWKLIFGSFKSALYESVVKIYTHNMAASKRWKKIFVFEPIRPKIDK